MVRTGYPTGSPELVRHWPLPADPEIVSALRTEVLRQCADWGVESRAAADVALVAHELLANAAQHGKGPLLLTMRAGTTHIYVGVIDRAPDAPAVPSQVEPEAEAGRGLSVVEALSTTWAMELQAAGSKLVWATVPATWRVL